MQPVGIIANPASGKDIRRLVAYGSVFDNNEKVNIVRRLLLGLEAMGVGEVCLMPDFYGIGIRALEDLEINLKPRFLDMEMEGVQDDSTQAARMMSEQGVACIITLGGDGTNRAVAKACGETPLLPLSTGTNNVFPAMTESTLAGLAAGALCLRPDFTETCLERMPRLEVKKDGRLLDMALVDVVISRGGFVASRALWDVDSLYEIFLARSEPGHIGFSSVGGHLGLEPHPGRGVHLVIGPGGLKVKAPIAPGLVRWVPIKSHRIIAPGEEVEISSVSGLVALDGERELVFKAGDRLSVSLSPRGPWVVDIGTTISRAASEGLFVEPI